MSSGLGSWLLTYSPAGNSIRVDRLLSTSFRRTLDEGKDRDTRIGRVLLALNSKIIPPFKELFIKIVKIQELFIKEIANCSGHTVQILQQYLL